MGGGGLQRAALLGDAALAASAVVANCAMNRERQLAGVNSYARELGFSPLDIIRAVIAGGSGPEAGTAATSLGLVCAPVAAWEPDRRFGLITCVRGLHYIGDKLALLTRVAGWLTSRGRLVADLDLSARHSPNAPARRGAIRSLATALAQWGGSASR